MTQDTHLQQFTTYPSLESTVRQCFVKTSSSMDGVQYRTEVQITSSASQFQLRGFGGLGWGFSWVVFFVLIRGFLGQTVDIFAGFKQAETSAENCGQYTTKYTLKSH